MRQSADIGAYAPYENAVFVGIAHRHAWRIRRRTISKPAKTDMVNRVFASRFDYWLSRGDVGAAKIDKTAILRFFVRFPILLRVRKLSIKNSNRFADLRTLQIVIFICTLLKSPCPNN